MKLIVLNRNSSVSELVVNDFVFSFFVNKKRRKVMKKLFVMVLCVAMILASFATLSVNAAVLIAADDTEQQVNFFQIDEYINADGSPNGDHVVNYTNVDDSYAFTVSVIDSGVYEFRTDVCSPWGIGSFDVYVDDELVASSGKFASSSEDWSDYAHSEYTYINFEDDGEYIVKYVITQDGINLKLPVVRYYDEVMPGETQAPTAEPTATPEPTQAPTQAPTTVPTAAPTAVPTTAPTKVPAAEEESGCGSSAMIAQVMLVLGAAVILKKRK